MRTNLIDHPSQISFGFIHPLKQDDASLYPSPPDVPLSTAHGEYSSQATSHAGFADTLTNEGIIVIMSVALTLAVAAIIYQRINYSKRYAALKQVAKQAENKALGAQLTPHFLYNVLNTVSASIVRGNIDESLNLMGAFSHLMRQVFRNARKNLITIKDELQTVNSYVDLELARLEHKFIFEINCPKEAEHLHIPSLFIQPLVENSIWHGIATSGSLSKIQIDIQLQHRLVQIAIRNTGKPIADDTIVHVHLNKASALSVLQERIEALRPVYGEETALTISPEKEGEYCTAATITFPQITNPLICLN